MNRTPPNNIEAEIAVLGRMMIDSESSLLVISELSAKHFYQPLHQDIFAACRELFELGTAIDLLTVAQQLMAKKGAAGGYASKLSQICENASMRSTLPAHMQILKDTAKMREIIALNQSVLDMCYQQKPIDWITGDFGAGFFGIVEDRVSDVCTIGDKAGEVVEAWQQTYETGEVKGLMTGFIDLDRRTNGFQGGDLIILAARPSMGKSALAMAIAANVAKENIPVLVYSLEMSAASLSARYLTSEARVSGDSLRKGNVTEHQLITVRKVSHDCKSVPIFIDDTASINIIDAYSKSKLLHIRQKFGLIIFDYIQLISANAESRTQEISVISRNLKKLAKDLDVPVIALSQLNRNLEARPNKRPVMSDLKESSQIEQDADVIMFIYRDEVYNPSADNPNRGLAEIITAKQRNGPTGVDRLVFRGDVSRFENYAH